MKPFVILALFAASISPVLASNSDGNSKVSICHATGSVSNPYVLITVSPQAEQAHAKHQDSRDVTPGTNLNMKSGPTDASSCAPAPAPVPTTPDLST